MMTNKRTSTFNNGLIWFGAGISIAEILTGTYFAPLGLSKGIAAVLLGHLIGGIMMLAAGLIGARERKSSMESAALSFGDKGVMLFALINVIQLACWTAIMIYDGAISATEIFHISTWVWCLLIGGLILVWIMIGLTNLGKVNVVAMGTLFVLTLIMAKVVFFSGKTATPTIEDSLTFGAAVELAAAMPLSWLPIISDYTREAEKPVQATYVSVLTYNIVSIFMYTIGMGAAIFTGETDISLIMVKAGLGVIGLIIVVFSTVTTTFLDAYSAGVSFTSIFTKANEKTVGVIVTLLGTVAAITLPLGDITEFLYFIGSVFAPMVAVMVTDYFILKKPAYQGPVNVKNICIWLCGFIAYRFMMRFDTPIGITILDIVFTAILCVVLQSVAAGSKQEN